MAVTQLQLVDDVSRRAEALAKVQEMHDQLTEAHAKIALLEADLNREHDRVVMVVEERDRYRHEAVRFRELNKELATCQTNARLILQRAEDVLLTIAESDAAPTPTSAAIDALEAEYKAGAK